MLTDTLTNIRQMLVNRRAGALMGIASSLLFVASLTSTPVSAACGEVTSSLPSSCCSESTLPSGILGRCHIEKEVPTPAPVKNDDVCVTRHTNVAFENNVISIYSGKKDGNPNGFLVTEIPLSAIRAVSDEEKATNEPILVYEKESEFADGWKVQIYWEDNHYGIVVTGDGSRFYDDTNDCVDL